MHVRCTDAVRSAILIHDAENKIILTVNTTCLSTQTLFSDL